MRNKGTIDAVCRTTRNKDGFSHDLGRVRALWKEKIFWTSVAAPFANTATFLHQFFQINHRSMNDILSIRLPPFTLN